MPGYTLRQPEKFDFVVGHPLAAQHLGFELLFSACISIFMGTPRAENSVERNPIFALEGSMKRARVGLR